jgi:hypothetical protein
MFLLCLSYVPKISIVAYAMMLVQSRTWVNRYIKTWPNCSVTFVYLHIYGTKCNRPPKLVRHLHTREWAMTSRFCEIRPHLQGKPGRVKLGWGAQGKLVFQGKLRSSGFKVIQKSGLKSNPFQIQPIPCWLFWAHVRILCFEHIKGSLLFGKLWDVTPTIHKGAY